MHVEGQGVEGHGERGGRRMGQGQEGVRLGHLGLERAVLVNSRSAYSPGVEVESRGRSR